MATTQAVRAQEPVDLEPARLQAAFRSHPFPKMPTMADIRSHLAKAEEGAANLEAEQKWQQVLTYAQSPNTSQ